MYNNEQEKLRKFKEVRELLNPKNDYVFKRIFGYKGNENITKDFLNSVIDDEVEEVDLEHN